MYVTNVETVYSTEYSTVPSYITTTVEVTATKGGEYLFLPDAARQNFLIADEKLDNSGYFVI